MKMSRLREVTVIFDGGLPKVWRLDNHPGLAAKVVSPGALHIVESDPSQPGSVRPVAVFAPGKWTCHEFRYEDWEEPEAVKEAEEPVPTVVPIEVTQELPTVGEELSCRDVWSQQQLEEAREALRSRLTPQPDENTQILEPVPPVTIPSVTGDPDLDKLIGEPLVSMPGTTSYRVDVGATQEFQRPTAMIPRRNREQVQPPTGVPFFDLAMREAPPQETPRRFRGRMGAGRATARGGKHSKLSPK